MTTFRSVSFAALCLAVLLAASAPAQTYTISTYQGNGQIIKTGCSACLGTFQPLWAKVVDANSLPAPAGTVVSWSGGYGALQTYETLTDANGLTSNTYHVNTVYGSPATPFIQSTIYASVGNSTATFIETQELAQQFSAAYSTLVSITPQQAISGASGSQGQPIQVQVWDPNKGGVQGVEVLLVNSQASPSVSCATGTGADPGGVMTDTSGSATCTPILSGTGTGIFLILVGGVADNPIVYATPPPVPPCGEVYPDGGGAFGYGSSSCLALTVTAPSPGSIEVANGNNQVANAGQALPTQLTAIVRDTNGHPMANQTVNWTFFPATAGALTRPSSSSDANGQVQNGFTFSATANGVVTITATIAGTSLSQNFSETAVQVLTVQFLQKISGDSPVQTAVSGQNFPNPLIVQANYSNSAPAVGVTVIFSLSGPASFTTVSSPQTNSSGRAQVSLAAASTTSQAQVTVTATIPGVTPVSFQLIVMPPGPTNLTFLNAADQKQGSISPCSMAMVTGSGLAPGIQGTLTAATFGPAPTTWQGDSIAFPVASGTIQAPIFSISNIAGVQSLTFQVPCEVPAGATASPTVFVGGGSATVNVPVLAASPGVYGSVGPDGVTRAVLARADGSFVSLANPARRGESITAFVTGLGPTTPSVGTNQVPPRGTPAIVNGTVVPGMSGQGAYLYSQPKLTADLVGVYEVNFTVPMTVNPNNNNTGFSVGLIPVGASVAQYSNLIYIPVGQ